jgi:hypothetical protein
MQRQRSKAHAADLKVQVRHGVQCLKYWFNEPAGKVFCLPSADANAVHRAHGFSPKIIEVDPDMGDVSRRRWATLPARIAAGRQRATGDPGIRSVLFTDIVGSTMNSALATQPWKSSTCILHRARSVGVSGRARGPTPATACGCVHFGRRGGALA